MTKKQPLFISNSQIQTYKDCRRKWYLQYYRELGPKQDKIAGPLGLGTKVHIVLETIYMTDDDPLAVLTTLYDEDEQKVLALPFPDDEMKKLGKERDLAFAIIEGFIQWREEEGIDADYEMLSAEEVLTHEVLPGVFLRGKLDNRLRRKSDGAILFNDWKTTVTFTDRWLLVLNEQMKFYMLLEWLISEGKQHTDGALYTMLRKVKRTAAAKPPFYMREEVRHNTTEIQNFYRATMSIVEEIVRVRQELDSGLYDMHDVVPPRPSRDCTWKCPFTAICPLFDDGSMVELAIQEHFEHVDPDARYNNEETND